VRLKRAEYEWGSDTIEYTAVGTAVHVDGAPPAAEPVLTTFSGEEYWKLLQSGYGPAGVAASSCVYYQAGWDSTNSFWAGGWANRELSDLTKGVRRARGMAQSRLQNASEALGATGVVGVSITQRQHDREVEMGEDLKRTDIIFTFLTLGTAIAPLKHGRPEANVKGVMPLSGRGLSRKSTELGQ
jgi:uncharacterized protein YbjQ (UPF0145 family)